jgi:hypothetical protein
MINYNAKQLIIRFYLNHTHVIQETAFCRLKQFLLAELPFIIPKHRFTTENNWKLTFVNPTETFLCVFELLYT